MKDRKGFTLVELLAVIVILAIIMIIAIPSVLGTLETARRKTFVEYITRVMEAGQNQYLTQLSSDSLPKEKCVRTSEHKKPCYVETWDMTEYFYDITTDLGLSSTGSYKGYVCIIPTSGDLTQPNILVALYDTNYMTHTTILEESGNKRSRYYINYTLYGEPDTDEIIAVSDHGIDSINAAYIGNEAGDEPWGIGTLCENKITEEED